MKGKAAYVRDEILQVVDRFPDGIAIDELAKFVSAVPRRTLQYRVSRLVRAGNLMVKGQGRSTKYYTAQEWVLEEAQAPQETSEIPYSAESLAVQRLINVPVHARRRVSYQKEFLDSYQPNRTFYLSEPIRDKLLKLNAGMERGRPAGTYARTIYQRLLIDLSWNSSRLEGNTYSLLETDRLLATGEEVPGKDRRDTQMILNHKDAIEFIVDMAEEVDTNDYTILNIHALLSENLLVDKDACGRLRKIPVRIGQSVYLPLAIPQVIEEYFQRIITKAMEIRNPFEKSFFLLIHLPYLQPFLDVNKRVSRLAANIPFIRENLSPLSFVDVPEIDYVKGLLAVYELNRIELFRDVFVWAYERSAPRYLETLAVLGPPDPFRMRYRDLMRQTIATVVQSKMNKIQAAHFIAMIAKASVPPSDQSQFIEKAEFEASCLHKGNFARFKIRPSEFDEWKKVWL